MMPMDQYFDLIFKTLVAFFITVGWAVILFPIIRKRQGTWISLVIAASLFTAILVFLKEIMDFVSPVFDTILSYGLGIFFAVGILTLIFGLHHRELKTPPRNYAFYRKHGFAGNLSLRNLFQLAIALEAEGEAFYRRLAAKLDDPQAKKVCLEMAKEEEDHQIAFRDYLLQWLPELTGNRDLQDLIQKFKMSGIFLFSPPETVSEQEMIKFAIDIERKFVEFYQSFEDCYPEIWKRLKVEFLIQQEKEHLEKFKKLLEGRGTN